MRIAEKEGHNFLLALFGFSAWFLHMPASFVAHFIFFFLNVIFAG